jgi:DNA mismatch repair protein MutH
MAANEAELLGRARDLAGRTVAEVAARLTVPLPPDPRRAKGFVGQLVERALGGACNSRAEPDFPSLGIELKTLPVDRRGRVRESTFVCTAPLAVAAETEWPRSRVRAKLRRVLWVVVEADRRVAPAHRRFGAAWLWSPSTEEEALLRADWEELMGLVGAGEIETIDARRGRVLQLRPKAADASVRTVAFDADGAPFWAPPRGFYLRATFTAALLERAGLCAAGAVS